MPLRKERGVRGQCGTPGTVTDPEIREAIRRDLGPAPGLFGSNQRNVGATIALVGFIPLVILAAILHFAHGNDDRIVEIVWTSPMAVTIAVDNKIALEAPGAGTWAVKVNPGGHTIGVTSDGVGSETTISDKTSGHHVLISTSPNQCFVEADAWGWATHPKSRPLPTQIQRFNRSAVINVDDAIIGLDALPRQARGPRLPVIVEIACDAPPIDDAWLRSQFPAGQ